MKNLKVYIGAGMVLAALNIGAALSLEARAVPIWLCGTCYDQGGDLVECCQNETCQALLLEKCCDPMDPECPPVGPD